MGGCCGTERKAGTELPDVAPGYGKKSTLAHQQKTWEATGVVSLRDSKLKVRRLPQCAPGGAVFTLTLQQLWVCRMFRKGWIE